MSRNWKWLRSASMGCAVLLGVLTAASAKSPRHRLRQVDVGAVVRPIRCRRETSAAKDSRALIVDGQVKEYMLGAPHELTECVFVMRRAFRVHDSLPEDSTLHWQWQLRGWLLVDRVTGHVPALNLPDFEAFYSAASWYRDSVAYCEWAMMGRRRTRSWRNSAGGSRC